MSLSFTDNYEVYDLKQLEFEEEYQTIEKRISSLESQIRQKPVQHLSSEGLQVSSDYYEEGIIKMCAA